MNALPAAGWIVLLLGIAFVVAGLWRRAVSGPHPQARAWLVCGSLFCLAAALLAAQRAFA